MTKTEGLTQDGGLPSPVFVEVIDGPSKGAKVILERGTVFVGSGEGWRSSARRPGRASRKHVSFELLGAQVRVRDLNSRNGTKYLGAKVAEAIVPVGATVEVGRSVLRVRLVTDPQLPPSEREELAGLVGRSTQTRRVFALVEKLGPADGTVLVTGESGAGKDAVSRALHQLSPRAAQPLVVFECAAASANLIESTLFGHVRGAFTGAERDRQGLVETAGKGTLLLDEVGMMPLELQPRLLRLLESREFSRVGESQTRKAGLRVLATSQRDLQQEVKDGRFRQDLYYPPLAVAEVQLRPLRERRDDIPVLARHFARQLAGHEIPLSGTTLASLQHEPWPGNARELRNAVARAFALGRWESPKREDGDAPTTFQQARAQVLQAFEGDYLKALLQRHQHNVSAAAREAGLARSAFYRLLARHALSDEAEDAGP